MTLKQIRDFINTVIATRAERKRVLDAAIATLAKQKSDLELADLCVSTGKKVYDSRVTSFFMELEGLINMGLLKVLNREYQFKIEYLPSGVKFLLASEETGFEFTDIMNSHGGGVVQIISFILQVYAMQYSASDKVFMLDEPFAQLSRDHKEKLAELIHELCLQFNYQFIFVTHDLELLEYLTQYPEVCNYSVGLVNNQTQLI